MPILKQNGYALNTIRNAPVRLKKFHSKQSDFSLSNRLLVLFIDRCAHYKPNRRTLVIEHHDVAVDTAKPDLGLNVPLAGRLLFVRADGKSTTMSNRLRKVN